MPIEIAPRRKYRFKINEKEFILTKLLLDNLFIDFESNYELSFNCLPISYGGTMLHYAERYASLMNIPNNLTLFRPLKNDRHANILIDMFDQLDIIRMDNINIHENIEDDIKKYSGYFTYKGKKINRSYTYNMPNIPTLKSFMISKFILDSEDYKIFTRTLFEFNRKFNHGSDKS